MCNRWDGIFGETRIIRIKDIILSLNKNWNETRSPFYGVISPFYCRRCHLEFYETSCLWSKNIGFKTWLLMLFLIFLNFARHPFHPLTKLFSWNLFHVVYWVWMKIPFRDFIEQWLAVLITNYFIVENIILFSNPWEC